MDLVLITITEENIHWAVNLNFERIFEALKYKVQLSGSATLQGNWNFQNLYTIRGITSNGPCSAYPNTGPGT